MIRRAGAKAQMPARSFTLVGKCPDGRRVGDFRKTAQAGIRLVTQRALKSKRALQQARMQRAVDTTMIADRRLPQEHRIALVALPRDPRYQGLFRSYRIGSE